MTSTEELKRYAQALANAGHLGPEERQVVMERIDAAPYVANRPAVPTHAQMSAPEPRRRSVPPWGIVAGLLAVIALAVGGTWVVIGGGDDSEKAAPSKTEADDTAPVLKLDEAAIESGLAAMSWDGDEDTIDITISEDGAPGDAAALRALLSTLGFRDAVPNRMSRTRRLDGTQSATSPTTEITWTYHPDDGLQIVASRLVEGA